MSRTPKLTVIALIFGAVLALTFWLGPRAGDPVDRQAVVKQYAEIGHAVFADSLIAANELQHSIQSFLASPSKQTLQSARSAWRAARIPYMQSEVFRFGNPPVDAWEGQVNAWPLDEGLIDYVAGSYVYEQGNAAAQANLIANPDLQVGKDEVNAEKFTPELLAELNEIGGSEANVASGYHAIEFLLWGQDLNGTDAGAGDRPHTDYATNPKACTSGSNSVAPRHCERRRQYLRAATQLLINDLEYMVSQWSPSVDSNYRDQLLNQLPESEALRRMLFGMGSLALGELAGERMKVALVAHSTEDEHDCFSDNTHNSHYYDALGIANIYHGEYARTDGELIGGPSIADMLEARDPEAATAFDAALDTALNRLNVLVQSAESGEHFDQLIAPGNAQGNKKVQQAIDALVVLAEQIEGAADIIGVKSLQPDSAGHRF